MTAALPVDEALDRIDAALRERGTLLLEAPPGSGKTTRVPPRLARRRQGQVVVLEPRRLAARAAARRVAAEWGCAVGAEVGFQVRDDRAVSDRTRVRFVTEGVLVRQLLDDPFLESVAVVVLDEFHERHLEGDLALAMLAEVRETVRPDLEIAVLSATLDPEPLRAFLPGPAEVAVGGTLFPVETAYLGREPGRALADRVRGAVGRALDESGGDVLVFLPGTGEIRATAAALAGTVEREGVAVLPLHGRLDPAEQDRALRPATGRKVILATNVAESSVTVPGVTAVVDSGLARVLRHDPGRGLDALGVESISRASADQRRGRAGRTAPGRCYRMWSPADERRMPVAEEAEVHRVDLAPAVLTVRAFAARDPRQFRWFEAPDPRALQRAEELLDLLGALDRCGGLTPRGRRLLAMPVHPRLARMVDEGRERGCIDDAATAAALVAEADPGPRAAEDPERADLLEWARAARRDGLPRPAERLRRRLRRTAGGGKAGPGGDPDALGRCVLAAFPDRLVRRRAAGEREGTMVGGRGVLLPPAAADDGLLAVAVRVTDVGSRRRSAVAVQCAVEWEWLDEVAPAAVVVERDARLDEEEGRLRAVTRTRYLDLVLEESAGGALDPEQVERRLRPLLERDPWRWLGPADELRAFLARVAWLRGAAPELGLPSLGDAEVAAAAVRSLGRGGDLRVLGDRDLVPGLRTLLGAAGGRLDALAPARVTLPSGRRARIDYAATAGPTVRARIQEWFGTPHGPAILGGRVPLVLEIQGPHHRPVQVTSDLAGFWQRHYPELRRTLSRRYPRHAWPEDPVAAAPPRRRRR